MNFTVACDGESGPAERFRDDVQGMHVPPPHHLACRKTPPSSERHGDGVLVLWRAIFSMDNQDAFTGGRPME